MPRGFAEHAVRRRTAADRSVWAGAAFVVEALILLAFLAACLAVFMQLFGESTERGRQNVQLEEAVELATNRAEQFAADPLAGMELSAGAGGLETAAGDYTVTCDVTPEGLSAGVLYHADICVWSDGSLLYELNTARYVSGPADIAVDDPAATAFVVPAPAPGPAPAANAGADAGADAPPDVPPDDEPPAPAGPTGGGSNG